MLSKVGVLSSGGYNEEKREQLYQFIKISERHWFLAGNIKTNGGYTDSSSTNEEVVRVIIKCINLVRGDESKRFDVSSI